MVKPPVCQDRRRRNFQSLGLGVESGVITYYDGQINTP